VTASATQHHRVNKTIKELENHFKAAKTFPFDLKNLPFVFQASSS
jgi:hypothetical protein